MTKLPTLRHPNCKINRCPQCLEDHDALDKYLYKKLGNCALIDWFGEYMDWLEENGINSQSNGWASPEAFMENNIKAFIKQQSSY